MTIDEAIKHAKEVAEEQEKTAKEWHENQVRKCELIPFAEMDYTNENECRKCAEEHRQLAEWLKDYKRLKEKEPCDNAIRIVRCGQCKYAEVADSEDSQDGYTCQFHRGSIWFSGSYCSWAERRQDG